MVKLGNNLSDKNNAKTNAKTVSEDGFDTIPLITPLDASQLQFPVLDKVTLLVTCALAFLVCVMFLVVYKVYQYEQPCPDGFMYTQGRCMPTGIYGYYPPGGRGRLFTIINHYNMAKQTITRSVSPWMTVMSEEKVTQQETETHQKLA
ncbi:neuronal vesicle trafficking-associated protein 1-like isoform X2 [Salvelinus namaycush]|uniref:Neuronal vesicle trafficking-associated protein 1 n=1 Tax=Salvelinus namaycush TaxID=8040 RepID=A0A8U0PLR5_SALNM|nr:neuronal vesicle trafficking-associated protein 1-like isoform X2 [Salvelinus namaycush]